MGYTWFVFDGSVYKDRSGRVGAIGMRCCSIAYLVLNLYFINSLAFDFWIYEYPGECGAYHTVLFIIKKEGTMKSGEFVICVTHDNEVMKHTL